MKQKLTVLSGGCSPHYKPEEYLNGTTNFVTGIVKDYKGKKIVVEKEKLVKVQ